MSILDELKNDGNEQFTPTIKVDEDEKQFTPGLVQGESLDSNIIEQQTASASVQHTKNSSFSMVSGVRKHEERQKADFNDLPKNSYEEVGVDTKESIEQEILGEGGIFDQYVDEKKKEFYEYLEEYDLEQEINGSTTKTDEKDDSEIDEIDTVSIPTNVQYSHRDINFDDEEEGNMEPKEYDLHGSEIEPDELDLDYEEENLEDDKNDQEIQSVSEEKIDSEDQADITEDIEVNRSSHQITDENDIIEDDEIEISKEDVVVEDDGMTDDQRIEIFKSLITEKLKPVSKKLDISSFTIAKQGVNSNRIENNTIATATWVLPVTGVCVEMKEISGTDLDRIRFAANSQDTKGLLKVIYNNIVSSKPDSFEVWMKSIAAEDYDHLFMAIYVAAFAESNYIPGYCENEKCKEKHYITDNIPMKDMVKFKDDEAKKRFNKIMKEKPVNSGIITSEVVPITEKIAISFKIPTLYSQYIEPSYLDKDFIDKYNEMYTFLPYIDNVFLIDEMNKTLIPIEYKLYANNIGKTIKSKIVTYNKIFKQLSIDEINITKAYINELSLKHTEDITYCIPESTCPHCNHVNKGQENQTAVSLVFSRNQLGLLVTT